MCVLKFVGGSWMLKQLLYWGRSSRASWGLMNKSWPQCYHPTAEFLLTLEQLPPTMKTQFQVRYSQEVGSRWVSEKTLFFWLPLLSFSKDTLPFSLLPIAWPFLLDPGWHPLHRNHLILFLLDPIEGLRQIKALKSIEKFQKIRKKSKTIHYNNQYEVSKQ